MKKRKGFVAFGMAFWIFILVTVIFFTVKYQEKQVLEIANNINNEIKGDINMARADLKEKLSRGKEITNYKLNNFGETKYDDGTVSEFDIIDKLSNKDGINIDKTQFIDRLITSRRTSLSFVWEKRTPWKINNTFRLELVKFLDDTNRSVWRLNDLTLYYWTSRENTPDVYILINRIKKDKTLNLDDTWESSFSKQKFGQGRYLYWKSWNIKDLFSLDFKKIPGSRTWHCPYHDSDLNVDWCKRINFNDFLSNDSFDLNNYFYNVYLVFWNTKDRKDKVPFKVTSPSGVFWLGNFKYSDVTLLTDDNTKKRFIIESSASWDWSDGGVLPYLVYSLWVSWDLKTKGE